MKMDRSLPPSVSEFPVRSAVSLLPNDSEWVVRCADPADGQAENNRRFWCPLPGMPRRITRGRRPGLLPCRGLPDGEGVDDQIQLLPGRLWVIR